MKPEPGYGGHGGLRVKIKGEFWDEVYERGPDGRDKLVEVTKPLLNLQMDLSITLIARLLANDSNIFGGILFHAQGSGNPSWDSGPIPPPLSSDVALVAEQYRKAPDSIVYLDNLDAPTLTPTNVLRVRTTYDFGELVGVTIREQALFGGDATATTDSGMMLNALRQVGRFKSGGIKLTRNVKLTLST